MENDTPNKIKISKEIIATLPIETFPGKIVVIDNERDADNAVLQLTRELSDSIQRLGQLSKKEKAIM